MLPATQKSYQFRELYETQIQRCGGFVQLTKFISKDNSLSLISPDCLQSSGKFLELMLRELHGICSLHYVMNIVPQTAGRLLRRAEDPAQFPGGTKWHYSKS